MGSACGGEVIKVCTLNRRTTPPIHITSQYNYIMAHDKTTVIDFFFHSKYFRNNKTMLVSLFGPNMSHLGCNSSPYEPVNTSDIPPLYIVFLTGIPEKRAGRHLLIQGSCTCAGAIHQTQDAGTRSAIQIDKAFFDPWPNPSQSPHQRGILPFLADKINASCLPSGEHCVVGCMNV